jgi:hypothetical protein
MVVEIGIGAGNGWVVGGEVLGLERLAIGRQDETGLASGRGGAGAQGGEGGRRLARGAGGDVDVVGLQYAAKVGLVRYTGAQALESGVLIPKCFKELEGKLLPVKGFSASSEMACSISTAFIRHSRG